MSHRRLLRNLVLGALLAAFTPALVLAAEPQPINPPEGFAEVRAKFEDMTPEEVAAAGYRAEPPICIADPALGGMGVHAVNMELLQAQFPTAEPDPENPPILLLNADMTRVVGLEWEAKDIGQGEMELFGQPVTLQPGHPGAPEPHYMLHAYFRPNGQVLFAPFDPEVECPVPPDTATVGQLDKGIPPLAPAATLVVVFAATFGLLLRRRAF